ncbi:MAG: trypsin-like peptidase domain-containing protein [Parcubacteria group bacterium]|nr:trypsin-like peptidase domain-containing protein [Parcubacteria group bacterium]
MVVRRLVIVSLVIVSFIGILVGCGHVERNREVVHPIRVSREIPDSKIKIKINTKSGEHSLVPTLPFKTRSENGENSLALNLQFNEKTKIMTGSASGVVLTHDGLILTNHHVTRTNSKSIEVVLRQGRDEVVHRGQLVSFSKFHGGNDLAVIKVNAYFPQVAHFGESRQIRVSDNVYNWGFPFGLSSRSHGKNYFFGHISMKNVRIPFFSKQPRFLMGIRGIGGVSGSGIFGDDGRLIGLMQGHSGYGLWMVGIPVDQIREFLDERGIPYSG